MKKLTEKIKNAFKYPHPQLVNWGSETETKAHVTPGHMFTTISMLPFIKLCFL